MRGGTIVTAEKISVENRSVSPGHPAVHSIDYAIPAPGQSSQRISQTAAGSQQTTAAQTAYNTTAQSAKAPLRLVSPDQRNTIQNSAAQVIAHDPRPQSHIPSAAVTSPSARRVPPSTWNAESTLVMSPNSPSPLLSLGGYQVDKGVAMHHSGHHAHLFSPPRNPVPQQKHDGYTHVHNSPQPRIVAQGTTGHTFTPTSYRPMTSQGGTNSPPGQPRPVVTQTREQSNSQRIEIPPTSVIPAVPSVVLKKNPNNLGLEKYKLTERGFPPAELASTTSIKAVASVTKAKSVSAKSPQGNTFSSPKSSTGKELVITGLVLNPGHKSNQKSDPRSSASKSQYYQQVELQEEHPDIVNSPSVPEVVISASIRLVSLKPTTGIVSAAGADWQETEVRTAVTKIQPVDTLIVVPKNLATYNPLQNQNRSVSTLGMAAQGGSDSTHSVSGISNKGSGANISGLGAQTQSQGSALLQTTNAGVVSGVKESSNGSKKMASTTAGSHSIAKAAKAADSGSLSSKSVKLNNIYSNLGHLSSTSRGSNANSGRVKTQVKSSSVSRERRTIIRSVETGLNRGAGTGRKISNPSFTAPSSDEPRAVRSFIGSTSTREHGNSPLVDSGLTQNTSGTALAGGSFYNGGLLGSQSKEPEIRKCKNPFAVDYLTERNPRELMKEMVANFSKNKLKVQLKSPFKAQVSVGPSVSYLVEVVELGMIPNVYTFEFESLEKNKRSSASLPAKKKLLALIQQTLETLSPLR